MTLPTNTEGRRGSTFRSAANPRDSISQLAERRRNISAEPRKGPYSSPFLWRKKREVVTNMRGVLTTQSMYRVHVTIVLYLQTTSRYHKNSITCDDSSRKNMGYRSSATSGLVSAANPIAVNTPVKSWTQRDRTALWYTAPLICPLFQQSPKKKPKLFVCGHTHKNMLSESALRVVLNVKEAKAVHDLKDNLKTMMVLQTRLVQELVATKSQMWLTAARIEDEDEVSVYKNVHMEVDKETLLFVVPGRIDISYIQHREERFSLFETAPLVEFNLKYPEAQFKVLNLLLARRVSIELGFTNAETVGVHLIQETCPHCKGQDCG